MKLCSWNINGLRAVSKKGFKEWVAATKPTALFLQEIKSKPEQIAEEDFAPPGYRVFWHPAQKLGYSGVAMLTRVAPLSVEYLGIPEFDSEGRCQIVEFDDFYVFNAYFPNSQEGGKRLEYKLAFCDAIFQKATTLSKTSKGVVMCGDFNIAHKPIDLTHPKANEDSPGYLPEERAWMDFYLSHGFVDTFRQFNSNPQQYTWWSYRSNARANNVGWRIDYFCTDTKTAPKVRTSIIMPDVLGSDHCPVAIEI